MLTNSPSPDEWENLVGANARKSIQKEMEHFTFPRTCAIGMTEDFKVFSRVGNPYKKELAAVLIKGLGKQHGDFGQAKPSLQ
jgi:hypothetical protein